MGGISTRGHALLQGALHTLVLLALALVVTFATGCTSNAEVESHVDTSGADNNQEQAQAEPTPEQEKIEFAKECSDGRGDVTCYAAMELTGKDMALLLKQQDYVWSERDLMWVKENGSAAFLVINEKGEHLSLDDMTALDKGYKQDNVCYRIITSRYPNARKSYEELASAVLDEIDFESAEKSAIGVCAGKNKERCLVFATASNDVTAVSVFSEPAVKAGIFDKVSGKEMGKTIEDVFKKVTNRALELPKQSDTDKK